MALYMMQIKPVSRSTGRSATAAAAYRSGTTIECEREGRIHDYSHKSGILKKESQIILPSGLSAEWALDRNQLWNNAESAEKRKDGRVAREYVIALPKEATAEERKQLVVDLSEYIANRYGVAVDMNIHAPHRTDEGHNDNYHAHLLTTTRVITESGLGQKSEVELSDSDRFKRNLSLSKDEVFHLRGYWAELQNQVLEKYSVQVSSLALEDQGIDREATYHLGARDTALERRGEQTYTGDLNRAIEARNLERLNQPLDLEQEIIASENLLKSLKHDYAEQIEADKTAAAQKELDDYAKSMAFLESGDDILADWEAEFEREKQAPQQIKEPEREIESKSKRDYDRDDFSL
jgi:ATP-dependent exoDNAse (exonuclease V) alpha subunit